MNSARTTIRISLGLGLIALAASAMADTAAANDAAGWYVGGNAGLSRAKIDDPRIIGGLNANGFTTTSIADDSHGLGYKVYGGYRFIRFFAVEGGYLDLGRFGFKATTLPPGTLNGQLKLRGANLDLVGMLPITHQFFALARIGGTYSETRDSFSGTGAVHVLNPSRKKWAPNYKFGLGLEYDFIPSLGLRLEAERYRIDDAVGNKGDIDLFSAGLLYRFGQHQPEPELIAAAPALPPPPPPPAAPPPPAPLPPPAPTKIVLSADSLFAFDKAVLTPAGQQELDKFAADLRGASYQVITVTGHTDRLGPHPYNQRLSTRRAEAVKTWLVSSGGIPADKINAIGVDGADPVTKPGDCPGAKATPELKACLQPDRRVEVEVSGTR
jgi:OOP family OmpA-OmpF porin